MARILIVEDDEQLAKILSACLAGAGHEIAAATDPVGFARQFRERRPDLLILDIQTPAGGGAQLKTMFEANPTLARVPTIVCSGMPVQEVKNWFPESAQRRYLPKPPDLARLRQLVAELLGRAAWGDGPALF